MAVRRLRYRDMCMYRASAIHTHGLFLEGGHVWRREWSGGRDIFERLGLR
ncbi:predicted protein [Histoplasma mississippiense (nom. inval.)]|nr:predicted protein [Histoplasma mississippiense (nom. inval.)]EDN02246.1 predicted protein [Histoplasma mississippiense (nom. inval.)]